ncbi:LEPR-XLL domain-containing protein [Kiloniella sp.]|uniref:LEPR-XLL domain-containing protein n=1 Tax=Kiloniella sp. TaxID=1938587 RepID=UPI003B029952
MAVSCPQLAERASVDTPPSILWNKPRYKRSSAQSICRHGSIPWKNISWREFSFKPRPSVRTVSNGVPEGISGVHFEPLESRFLLSADSIVPGLIGALESGLAGTDSSDGFADMLEQLIEAGGDPAFDNHVPGLALDEPATDGVLAPTIRDLLSIDTDLDEDGSTDDSADIIADIAADANAQYHLADTHDIGQIAKALNAENLDGYILDEENALGLIDQNDNGRVSLSEFFEVIIVGQVSEFLEQFPDMKDMGGLSATNFDDLMDGYFDDTDGAIQGFHAFLDDLSVPSLISGHVELTSFAYTNNDDPGVDAFDFDFDFTLTLSDQYLIDLGLAVESLEIDLPKEFYTTGGQVDYFFQPEVDVMGSLAMDLGFSVTTDGAADFGFSVADDIEVKAFVDQSLVGLNVNVGFLGMIGDTGSIFELNLPFDIELIDPSSPFHIGFGQADFEAAGDGMIDGVDGVFTATRSLDPGELVLNQDVIFSMTLGDDNGIEPVEVTVTAASTVGNTTHADLIVDINAALTTAGLDDILAASLDVSDKIVLSLVDSDATGFGFIGQEHFALAGFDLTATDALTHDFSVDGELFEAAVLMSLGAAQPKLVNMSFTVTGATDTDADRRADFLSQAQTIIDTAFGVGEITVSLDGTDHITFDPVDGADTLEITRAVVMSAEFNITATELAAATFDELLFNHPDADNDNFNIHLELLTKAGVAVSDGDLNTESLTLTDDLIVDDGGVITFPLETDISPDFIDVDRFDLEGSLLLSGTAFTSFDPTTDSFQKLLDFNSIGGSEVVGLISQLKGWLNRIPNTEMLAGYDIPFAEATLGDLLDFAKLIQDELLIDDGGNGLEELDDVARDDLDRLIGKISSLDENILSVTFTTAQELAARLSSLSIPNVSLAGGVANYNVALQELTYDITVTASGEIIDDAPIDFDLDLDPVTDVTVIADVVLDPTLTFEATMGFDLATSAMIEVTTLLEDLNNGDGVPISTGLALTSAEALTPIFGRLSEDATFDITLAGINGGDPLEVTLTKAATDDNLTTADLIADLNAAFLVADADPGAGTTIVDISAEVEAVEIAGRIVLQSIGAVDSFSIGVSTTDAAYDELGLRGTSATTVFLTGTTISSVPDTGIASFDVFLNGSGSSTTIEIDMAGANTVNDLVEDINTEIGSSGLDGLIAAARSGDAIVLAAVDASVDVFRIADNTDTGDLGLAAVQLDGLQEDGNFLSQVAGVFLIGENFLDTSINPVATTSSSFGRLVGDQTFTVDLGAAGDDIITVTAASTVGNTKLADLIDQINTEISGSAVAGKVVAVQVNAGQIALRTTSDDVETIEITVSSAPELGFLTTTGIIDGPLRISAADLAPFYYGPATEASFFLSYDDGVTTPEAFVPGDIVDGTDVVTLAGHTLSTGEAIQYNNTSAGSDIGGLLDGGFYFVIASDTDGGLLADEIKVAATLADAEAGTAIDLTGAGAGATHEFDPAVAYVVLEVDETLTNRLVYDLVSDITFALNDAFGGSSENPFLAGFDGQRLVIEAKDGSGITAFNLLADASNSAVTDLHLHELVTPLNPLGVGMLSLEADLADLLIHTQDGEIHRITLDGALDIMDVLDAIDTDTSSDVTGGVNGAMTGIDLTDHTGVAGPEVFRVESVNGSRAVFALGIQAADNNSLVVDFELPLPVGSTEIDHVINGDEVGSLDLEDRLFIRQVDDSTPVLSADFTLSIYVEDASAQFGFVGIEMDSLGVDPHIPIFETMEFEVSLTTNKGGDPENNVTLAELLDAISLDVNKDGVFDVHDQAEVLTYPTLEVSSAPTEDEFVFDVVLLPGADFISLGANPQLTMHMHDAGNLFNELPGSAEFDGTDTGIVDVADDELTLTAHGFESGDRIVYRDGDGDGTPIEGLVDNQAYFIIKIDDDTIQLAETRPGALADVPTPVDITGLGSTTTGPTTMHRLLASFDPILPDMHIHTSDFDDLDNLIR